MPSTIANRFTMAGDVDVHGALLGAAPQTYRAPDEFDMAIDAALADPWDSVIDEVVGTEPPAPQAPPPAEQPSMRAYEGPVENQPVDWYEAAGLQAPLMQRLAQNISPTALVGGLHKGMLVEPGAKIAEGFAAGADAIGLDSAAGSLRRGAQNSRAFWGNLPTGQAAAKGGVAAVGGELVGNIAPTAVGLGGATKIIPAFYALQAFGQGSEEYRKAIEKRGGTPDDIEAVKFGVGYGAVEFLAERLGLDVLGKIGSKGASKIGDLILRGDRKAAASAIGHWVGAGQAEGIEEGLTQFAQNAMAQSFDPERPMMQGVPESYGAGVAGGMLLGGADAIFNAREAARVKPTAQNPAQTPRETGTAPINAFEREGSTAYPQLGPERSPLTAKQQSDSNRLEAETFAKETLTSTVYGNYMAGRKDLDPERVLGAFKDDLEAALIQRFGISKTKARGIIVKFKSDIDALPASKDLVFDTEGRGVPTAIAREAEMGWPHPLQAPPMPSTENIDRSVEQAPPPGESAPPLIEQPNKPRKPHPSESVQTGQRGILGGMFKPNVSIEDREAGGWTVDPQAAQFKNLSYLEANQLIDALREQEPGVQFATSEAFANDLRRYTVVRKGQGSNRPSRQTNPQPVVDTPSPASAESPKPVGLMERLKGNTPQTSTVASQDVASPQSIIERAQELLDTGDAATMEEALQIAEADARADARNNVQPTTPTTPAITQGQAPKQAAGPGNGSIVASDENGAANGVAPTGVGESQTATRKLLSKKKAPAPEKKPKNPPSVRRITAAQVERHLDQVIENQGYSAIDAANAQYEAMRAAHSEPGAGLNPVGGDADHLQIHPDMISHLSPLDQQKVRNHLHISNDGVTDADVITSVERAIEEAVGGNKVMRRNFAKDVLDSPSQHDPETVLNAFLYTKQQELQDEIARTRPKTSQSKKAKAARLMDGAKKPSETNSELRALLDEKNAPKQFVNPKELPLGTTVTIYGEEFDVAMGKDGEKVIADGVIIPVDGLGQIPIDVGSQKPTDPNKTVDEFDLGVDDKGYTTQTVVKRPKFKDGFVLDDGLNGKPVAADEYGLPPELQGDGEDINEPGAFEEDDAPTGVTKDLFNNPVVDAATGKQQGLAFPEESALSKESKQRTADVEGQQKLRPTTPGRGRNQYPGSRGGSVDISGITDVAKGAAKGVRSFVNAFTSEMAESIRNTPAGAAVARYLDDASSKAATLVGKFANEAHDAYKGLEHGDRNWLDVVQPGQLYSNRQRLVDNTRSSYLTAPNPRIQAWVDAYKKMMNLTGDAAIAVGVKREDGSPFVKSTGPRAIREFTPDAWEAVHYGSGPLFEAIADTIASENGTSVQQAKDILKEQFDPSSVRHVGALENYRKIEFLPDHVKLGNQLVPILEGDPYLSIMNAGKRQAQRIYFVEKFGQETADTPNTVLDRLRAKHVQEGGSAIAFDDVVRVWNGRPYGRLGGDPRAAWKRAGKVIDTLISGQQTSSSLIPNIPQVLVQVPRYTGFINLAKGAKQVIMHPKASASILAEMGAVNRSVMEWTLRNGHVPEDISRIIHDLATRGLGSHWLNQFNSMAAGMAGKEMVNQWRAKGLSEAEVRTAEELRLTKSEIAAARKGNISKATENKIVQNIAKVTQYTTEDPHRRSLVQNVPILNFVFAYSSYFVGTTKSTLRAVDDVRAAIASGDPVKMRGAGERVLKLLIGMLGAGAVAMILRRTVKGQEIKKRDESYWDLAKAALWEVGVMGSAQRFIDAFHWSNASSVEKFAMAAMPKVNYIADFLNACFTTQKYQKYGLWEALGDMQKRNTPALNQILNASDRIKAPQYGQYIKTRTRVSDWMKDNDLDKPMMVDAPANPAYINAARAVGMGDIDRAAGVIEDSLQDIEPKGISDALDGIKRSMQDKSPLGRLNEADTPKYLKSLSPDERKSVLSLQRDWMKNYQSAIGKAMKEYWKMRRKDVA